MAWDRDLGDRSRDWADLAVSDAVQKGVKALSRRRGAEGSWMCMIVTDFLGREVVRVMMSHDSERKKQDTGFTDTSAFRSGKTHTGSNNDSYHRPCVLLSHVQRYF